MYQASAPPYPRSYFPALSFLFVFLVFSFSKTYRENKECRTWSLEFCYIRVTVHHVHQIHDDRCQCSHNTTGKMAWKHLRLWTGFEATTFALPVVGSNPVESLKCFQVIFPEALWLHSHLSFFHYLIATVIHLLPWVPIHVYTMKKTFCFGRSFTRPLSLESFFYR